MLFKTEYQPAELYAPAKGTWRISWYNNHPATDKLERIQKTFDINRIKDLSERKRVAKNYVSVINEALKNGYNYFVHTEGIAAAAQEEITVQATIATIETMIREMLPVRLLNCNKKRSVQTYSSYTTVFCDWLQVANYSNMPACDFRHSHWVEFMQYKQSQGHGNKNINDYISYFKTTFADAVPMGYIKANPIERIKYLEVGESTLFAEITPDELKRISAELLARHPKYYIYTRFTADGFVRPKHIAFIKASDIDYSRNIIKTYGDSAKNSRINEKELLPGLKQLLIDQGYHTLPGDWYLFGKGFEPSAKPYPSLSTRSAEIWKSLVIDGLGIDKKMYALKHTSGTFYINENEHADIFWLQKQMEHATLAQTEEYIRKRKIKKIQTDAKTIVY